MTVEQLQQMSTGDLWWLSRQIAFILIVRYWYIYLLLISIGLTASLWLPKLFEIFERKQ